MAQRGPPQGGPPQKQKVQKVMTQPINVIFRFFQSKTRVSVWLYDQSDTRIEGATVLNTLPRSLSPLTDPVSLGVILGFDEYMNLVMDDAEEVNRKKNTRKPIGRILLKGDNISLMMATGK